MQLSFPCDTHRALTGHRAACKVCSDGGLTWMFVCTRVCTGVRVCGSVSLQSLHTQKSDVDLMRTKLRRLEEENSRKDRQIEQLLDPSRVSRGPAWRRPAAAWVGAGPTPQAVGGRGRAARAFISASAYRRARILFGLWQRKGLTPAG